MACSLKEYQADHVKRYAVERLIELIVEYATDTNRHVVEVSGAAPPQTYYSTFEEMGKLVLFPETRQHIWEERQGCEIAWCTAMKN